MTSMTKPKPQATKPRKADKTPVKDSLEAMIAKARELGFSSLEISRLKAAYSPKKVDILSQVEMVGKPD